MELIRPRVRACVCVNTRAHVCLRVTDYSGWGVRALHTAGEGVSNLSQIKYRTEPIWEHRAAPATEDHSASN